MTRAASLRQIGGNAELRQSKPTGFDYIPAGLLVLIGTVGLGFAWMTTGAATGQYLIIAPPGSSLADTVNLVGAAHGGLIEKGRFSNIVIAGSNSPDFPTAVRRAGAWLAVAAPAGVGCSTPLLQEQSQ